MTTLSNLMSCPHCATPINAHSGHGGLSPTEGDFAYCWRCRGLSVFVATIAGLMLRLPTQEEAQYVAQDEQACEVRRAMDDARSPLHAEELLRRREQD